MLCFACYQKRKEAVLTTYGFLSFVFVFARRQHAAARTANCDQDFTYKVISVFSYDNIFDDSDTANLLSDISSNKDHKYNSPGIPYITVASSTFYRINLVFDRFLNSHYIQERL